MTIHDGHPFAVPEPDRDQARRFRGRLGGAVSLWTAEDAGERAGLTVSSLMVAPGEPAALVGLLDPDADLTGALRASGRCVVQLLGWRHRDLADAFAGTALGLLVSAFARTEFQAVQFMPVLIVPQIFLCGLLVPREQLPGALEALSNVLPLSYAVEAMNTLSTSTVADGVGRDIAVVIGFIVVFIALGAATLRRRTQ